MIKVNYKYKCTLDLFFFIFRFTEFLKRCMSEPNALQKWTFPFTTVIIRDLPGHNIQDKSYEPYCPEGATAVTS